MNPRELERLEHLAEHDDPEAIISLAREYARRGNVNKFSELYHLFEPSSRQELTTLFNRISNYEKEYVLFDMPKTSYNPTGVLYVAKDIVRKENKSPSYFTIYNAIKHCEDNGLRLPTMQESCDFLARLFRLAVRKDGDEYTTLDGEAKKILDQYKDFGRGHGWHAVNTLYDWSKQERIDFPQLSDFPEIYCGTEEINSGLREVHSLNNLSGLGSRNLSDALRHDNHKQFVHDHIASAETSLVLVDIGNYFGKPARHWVPQDGTLDWIGAGWLGCDISYFFLDTYIYLINISAVRGVREPLGELSAAGTQK